MKTRLMRGVLAVVCLAFHMNAVAQQPKPEQPAWSKTIVPDKTYDPNGTRTTISAQSGMSEFWQDSGGHTREYHARSVKDKAEDESERWSFYAEPGQTGGDFVVAYLDKQHEMPGIEDLDHRNPGWYVIELMPGKILQMFPNREAATRAAADFIAKAEKQFAKDGTIPDWTVETAVEQPKLAPDKPEGIDTQVEQPPIAPYKGTEEQQKAVATGSGQTVPPSGTAESNPAKDQQGTGHASGDKALESNPDHPTTPCTTTTEVSLTDAKYTINRYLAHVTNRDDAMVNAFYLSGATDTLRAAFQAKGVTTSMTYVNTWGGGGMSDTWYETVHPFYYYHQQALTESLKVLEDRGYATKTELDALDEAMKAWEATDKEIESQFRALVDSYTAEAKVLDQKAEYLKNYYLKLDQLARTNITEASALTSKMYTDVKAFDDRTKKMENEDQLKILNKIRSLTAQKFFKPLTRTSTVDKACK